MNIAEILLQRAEERGDRAAIVDVRGNRDRFYSFRDLDVATARVAGQLKGAGLEAGDGVLLLSPVAAELYLVLIALFRLGCVAMFLDPSAGREHIARCCKILPPKAFFGSPRAQLLRWVVPALRKVPRVFCFSRFPGARRLNVDPRTRPFREIVRLSEDAPALVTFTSGSTGQPKAALRTHGFLLKQHKALSESLTAEPGSRDLTTLPIFVLSNLASGVTSVLPDADLRSPGKIVAGPVLRQIRRHEIATTAASPALLSRLLDEYQPGGDRMASLRAIYIGGAPVFPGLLRRTKEAFPQAKIVAVYGSTEAEPMAEIALSDISQADFEAMEQGNGLLTGRPVPAICLRVIREQWGVAVPPLSAAGFESWLMPSTEPGEIVVTGGHVLPGYLHGDGDVETKFEVDGVRWHRTGDLGYLDAKGRLWLLGRCSAKVQDPRGTLYPFAVECAAMQNPSIRRAALVQLDGRRVLAVEAAEPVSPEKVQQALSWARLDEVVALDSIPVDRRHNAKVDYAALIRELRRRTR